MSYRILLLGGGSGGHVFPLIAVAEALKEKSQQEGIPLELMVLGEGGFMKKAAAEAGLKFKQILAGKLRRYFSPLTILDIFKIPVGFLKISRIVSGLKYLLNFPANICLNFNPASAAAFFMNPPSPRTINSKGIPSCWDFSFNASATAIRGKTCPPLPP